MNLSELDIKQTVHFTLGRFNPPTLGHKKLLDMVLIILYFPPRHMTQKRILYSHKRKWDI